jgi:hypothetical protein
LGIGQRRGCFRLGDYDVEWVDKELGIGASAPQSKVCILKNTLTIHQYFKDFMT